MNIIKKFDQTMSTLLESGYSKEDVDIYAVGRKIADHVKRSGFDVAEDLSDISGKPDYEAASTLAHDLGHFSSCKRVHQVVSKRGGRLIIRLA